MRKNESVAQSAFLQTEIRAGGKVHTVVAYQ